MKEKVLAILIATTMSVALIACGGEEQEIIINDTAVEKTMEESVEQKVEESVEQKVEETVEQSVESSVEEVVSEYTEEQLMYIEAYEQMINDYNATIELANGVPELLEDEELVNVMNELAAGIDAITELMADPANMTDEFLANLDTSMELTYVTINRVNSLAELLPILTIAGVGADEEENTYWFACSEDETVGVMVILSADQTQNVYCAGDMVINEDGTYTINDADGYTMTMAVEAVEDGLILTMQDGTVVGMFAAAPKDVIDIMLAIEEGTENVNAQ